MPTFSCKDVKDALASYECRHAPRFRTFQILGKKVEDAVKTTTKLWKLIFNVVDIENKEDKDYKENEETKEPSTTPVDRLI